jgi:hypothetical protein
MPKFPFVGLHIGNVPAAYGRYLDLLTLHRLWGGWDLVPTGILISGLLQKKSHYLPGTEYPGIENSIWKAPVNIYKNFDGDPQSGDPVIKTS